MVNTIFTVLYCKSNQYHQRTQLSNEKPPRWVFSDFLLTLTFTAVFQSLCLTGLGKFAAGFVAETAHTRERWLPNAEKCGWNHIWPWEDYSISQQSENQFAAKTRPCIRWLSVSQTSERFLLEVKYVEFCILITKNVTKLKSVKFWTSYDLCNEAWFCDFSRT